MSTDPCRRPCGARLVVTLVEAWSEATIAGTLPLRTRPKCALGCERAQERKAFVSNWISAIFEPCRFALALLFQGSIGAWYRSRGLIRRDRPRSL
jgi:hypothetical protein